MKDVEYTVSMLCPLCGNDQFEIIGVILTAWNIPKTRNFVVLIVGTNIRRKKFLKGT